MLLCLIEPRAIPRTNSYYGVPFCGRGHIPHSLIRGYVKRKFSNRKQSRLVFNVNVRFEGLEGPRTKNFLVKLCVVVADFRTQCLVPKLF